MLAMQVGAEMPIGRPSWFRVPAPSQGEFIDFIRGDEKLCRLNLTADLFVRS